MRGKLLGIALWLVVFTAMLPLAGAAFAVWIPVHDLRRGRRRVF